MSGIDEGEGHAVGHGDGAFVADCDELPHAFFRFDLGVEGFEIGLALLGAMFVEPLQISRLDARGVGEHDLAEITRREGRVDVSLETVARERGKVAAVVDVGVGEDHGVDARGIEGEVTVAVVCFVAAALVEATIQKNA